MGIRNKVGSTLESVVGAERVSSLRRSERKVRNSIAAAVALDPPAAPAAKQTPAKKKPAAKKKAPAKKAGWQPSDPFTPHPKPTMTRHELLAGLHEQLAPRTYLEVGVNTGLSLALSRVRSIGVDPAFKVENEIECDVKLVRATSDDFFADPEALAHFGGTPVDLAFIDGMHLSEFALRDFVNVERHMARTGVVVFDDMLPRNALEAARDRRTQTWAGDVYKVAEILRRNRPDLAVLLVNTAPTGTVVVVGVDPASSVMEAVYEAEVAYCLAPDPQVVPDSFQDRSAAVNATELLALDVWKRLVERRDDDGDLSDLWQPLLDLPTGH